MAEKLTVTISNRDLNSYTGVELVDYEVEVAPSIKSAGINTPGGHGLYNTYSPFSYSTFRIHIIVKGDTGNQVNQRLRTLTNDLAVIEDAHFIFSDDSQVYRKAKYQSSNTYRATNAINGWYIKATLTFVQTDPFKYALSPIIYETIVEGGQNFTFDNPGYETPYKITFTISATGYIFNADLQAVALGMSTYLNYLEQSGQYFVIMNNEGERYYSEFTYLDILNLNDTVMADGETYEVYINNSLNTTNWIGFLSPLAPGSNTVKLTTPEGYNMEVKIEFTPRYI